MGFRKPRCPKKVWYVDDLARLASMVQHHACGNPILPSNGSLAKEPRQGKSPGLWVLDLPSTMQTDVILGPSHPKESGGF